MEMTTTDWVLFLFNLGKFILALIGFSLFGHLISIGIRWMEKKGEKISCEENSQKQS